MNRRNFLKSTGIIGAGIGLAGPGCAGLLAAETPPTRLNTERLSWHLGIQTYTFHRFTLFEAIDKTASLGLKYIETIFFQRVSKDHPVNFDFGLPADVRRDVKKKLADSGVRIVGHFAGNGQVNQRALFEFCKDMGAEMIVSEPAEDLLDDIDKLCEEYEIDLALANHPKSMSRYWHPDNVMKACQGLSKRIGASGDIGHWVREGLNPLECIKTLEGRLLAFHFRDMNKSGPGTHDVPWGTGTSDVRGMIGEVHRQGVKPAFMCEYEYKFDNNMPEIAQSVKFFDKVVAELAGEG